VTASLCLLKPGLNDSQVFLDLPSQTWVSLEAQIPEMNGAEHLLERFSQGSAASMTFCQPPRMNKFTGTE
jgi:hypothetical protein